jgi:hypothetical protein
LKKKTRKQKGDFREKKVEKQRGIVLKTETERRRNTENAKKGRRITVSAVVRHLHCQHHC